MAILSTIYRRRRFFHFITLSECRMTNSAGMISSRQIAAVARWRRLLYLIWEVNIAHWNAWRITEEAASTFGGIAERGEVNEYGNVSGAEEINCVGENRLLGYCRWNIAYYLLMSMTRYSSILRECQDFMSCHFYEICAIRHHFAESMQICIDFEAWGARGYRLMRVNKSIYTPAMYRDGLTTDEWHGFIIMRDEIKKRTLAKLISSGLIIFKNLSPASWFLNGENHSAAQTISRINSCHEMPSRQRSNASCRTARRTCRRYWMSLDRYALLNEERLVAAEIIDMLSTHCNRCGATACRVSRSLNDAWKCLIVQRPLSYDDWRRHSGH